MGNCGFCNGGREQSGEIQSNSGKPDREYEINDSRTGVTNGAEIIKLSSKKWGLKDFPVISRSDIIGLLGNDTKQDYSSESGIGTTTIAKTVKAIHKITGQTHVLKKIKKQNSCNLTLEQLHREADILATIDHPNIIRSLGHYEDLEYITVVSEYAGETAESLADVIESRSFTEEEAASIMKQIFSALANLHQNNIIHRNLIPENVLFESVDGQILIKIVGFTRAVVCSQDKPVTESILLDHESYSSPEAWTSKVTPMTDIWSAGCILYELLSGNKAFDEGNKHDTREMVQKGDFSMEGGSWDEISIKARDLVRKLLQFSPNSRPSAIKALEHVWIRENTQASQEINEASAKSLKECLTHLKLYRSLQRGFSQACWLLISIHFTKNHEKMNILKAFKQIDEVDDGQLTKEELIKAYSLIWNDNSAHFFVNDIFNEIDLGGKNRITFTDFVVATRERSEILSDATLTNTFKLIDKDNDSVITVKDLQATFNKSQTHTDTDLFKNMIQSALNLAGYATGESINLSQFKKILNTTYETIRTEA